MASLVARAAAALSVLVITSTQARAGICVDVNLRFNDQQPPAALVEAMQLEAAAIWKTYGIDLCWHEPPARQLHGSMFFDVLIDRRHHGATSSVLGDARLPAQPASYADIRLDRQAVEALLRVVTFDRVAHLTGHARIGAVEVGRALGRVLAHELGHALLATRQHQATGLMRPSFSGEELLTAPRDAYGLSRAEVTRLSALRLAQHETADRPRRGA